MLDITMTVVHIIQAISAVLVGIFIVDWFMDQGEITINSLDDKTGV